jgi:hemerythrin superfamily protein
MTSKTANPKTHNQSSSKSGDATPLALAAGAGLFAGLAANFVRKAVVQAPSVLAGDWCDALTAEHKATLALFDAIQATTNTQTTKRTMLLTQLKHALAKHALQEENAVYAAMRDSGQTEEADALNHDHGYVKQYLYDLTMMPRDDAGWLPKVIEFRHAIEKHIGQEEREIFPALRAKLSADQNKALTTAMHKEGLKLA